jgi:hypothetical protein
MRYGERETRHWRCDECGIAIARPSYLEQKCFCSQACRQAFLSGSKLGVCHDATGLWTAAGIAMPAESKKIL